MKGHVRIEAWERRSGRRLWTRETDNLVVLAATTAVAQLIGGDPTANAVAAIGFGAGGSTPAPDNTALTTPAYYRAVDGVSYPSVGAGAPAQVRFAWSINADATPDYGASGIPVTEIGLCANPSAVVLPAAVGTAIATWTATHAYALHALVLDSQGNVQEATTAGTSGGSTPTWSTSINGTTTDGSAVWTLRAVHTAPTLLFARALLGLGTITPSVAFSSSWTITV